MPSVFEKDARTIGDWVALQVTGAGRVRSYSTNRVYPRGREIDSYGPHFPLARYVPRKGRTGPLWVINGDTWNGGGRGWNRSRTPDHQTAIRRAIADSGVPSIILPFSALSGAGIDIDSVRPLHVRADKTWTETHTLEDAPDLDNLETADRFEESDDRSTVDYRGNACASHGVWWRLYTWKRDGRTYIRHIYRQAYDYADGGSWCYSESWDSPVSEHIYMDSMHALERVDGRWTYETRHHRLGDSLFTAVREQTFTRDAAPFESESDGRTVSVRLVARTDRRNEGACKDNEWREHEAGPDAACIHCGVPLAAVVSWRRRARYLSSFDTNENPPLYFLCEVSRDCHPTVEGALDSLAPRAVHAAILAGTEVRRQGDVFFIDTPLTDADLLERGAVFGRLTQWTRDAAPRPHEVTYVHRTAGERRELARRELSYARKLWREQWRTDVQALTLRDSARPSGKRGQIAWAWRMQARDVYRRGYGSNALALWNRCKLAAQARYRPDTVATDRRERIRRHLAVYGTAHSATRVARVGTAVYVQGTVRHAVDLEPNRRGGPDHRPLTLTAGRWYLAVRNTVPRQNRRPRVRRVRHEG